MIAEIVLYGVSFCILIILQALFINGLFECCRFICVNDINKGEVCEGEILYKLFPKFIKNNKSKIWVKPLYGCVKCMSSLWGTITFWITILPLFGFNFYELWIWFADMFILTIVNYFIYKKA